MKLLKNVTLDSVIRKKDKSLRITFITETEQTSNELKEVDELLDSSGIMYYKADKGLSTDEIKQIDKITLDKPEGKSQSVRTRNALYVLCKQVKGSEPTKQEFAEYYKRKTEAFIQHILNQLEKD